MHPIHSIIDAAESVRTILTAILMAYGIIAHVGIKKRGRNEFVTRAKMAMPHAWEEAHKLGGRWEEAGRILKGNLENGNPPPPASNDT